MLILQLHHNVQAFNVNSIHGIGCYTTFHGWTLHNPATLSVPCLSMCFRFGVARSPEVFPQPQGGETQTFHTLLQPQQGDIVLASRPPRNPA